MQKIGLLSLPPETMSPAETETQVPSSGTPQRRMGLLIYSSDQPYGIGRDVILARWAARDTGVIRNKTPRKNGLLTIS